MSQQSSKQYGDIAGRFISKSAFDAYCTGQTDSAILSDLDNLGVEAIFPNGIRDQNLARCCLSGLWLLHNFLDRSHEISQEIKTPEGSFWHAIMHRMEADFWNSKYWYAKVGSHPVFSELEQFVNGREIEAIPNGKWSSEVFVDLCEAEQGSADGTAMTLARIEWTILFDHCFKNAGVTE